METLAIGTFLKLIKDEALPVVILALLVYHLLHINKVIDRIEKNISTLKEQIEELERQKVDKEQHLQDVSGWRWEIQRLEDRMEKFFDRLTQLIEMIGGKRHE